MTHALPAQPPSPTPRSSDSASGDFRRAARKGGEGEKPADFEGLLAEKRPAKAGAAPLAAEARQTRPTPAVEGGAEDEGEDAASTSEAEAGEKTSRERRAEMVAYFLPLASPQSAAKPEEAALSLVAGEGGEPAVEGDGLVDEGASAQATPMTTAGAKETTSAAPSSAFARELAAKGETAGSEKSATPAPAASSETSEAEAEAGLVGELPEDGAEGLRLNAEERRRHRAALVYGGRRETVAGAENSSGSPRFQPAEGAEKPSERASGKTFETHFLKNGGAEDVLVEGLKDSKIRTGIGVAKKEAEMFTIDSNLPLQAPAGSGAAAAFQANGVSATGAGSELGRASLLPSEIVKLHEQVARVAEAGGGRFELEWGGDSSDRVTVNVTLREGQWRVEFRSANPELTRFLEREWSQTAEFRNSLQGRGDAVVRFTADDSRQEQQGRQSSSSHDLSEDESAFLSDLRRRRSSLRHA
jgi:hypothetical protein